MPPFQGISEQNLRAAARFSANAGGRLTQASRLESSTAVALMSRGAAGSALGVHVFSVSLPRVPSISLRTLPKSFDFDPTAFQSAVNFLPKISISFPDAEPIKRLQVNADSAATPEHRKMALNSTALILSSGAKRRVSKDAPEGAKRLSQRLLRDGGSWNRPSRRACGARQDEALSCTTLQSIGSQGAWELHSGSR